MSATQPGPWKAVAIMSTSSGHWDWLPGVKYTADSVNRDVIGGQLEVRTRDAKGRKIMEVRQITSTLG